MSDNVKRARELLAAATPGPWTNGCDKDGKPITFERTDTFYPGPGNSEHIANLKLFEAAPTLLADLADEVEHAEKIAGDVARVMWRLAMSSNGDRRALPMLDGKPVSPEEWGREMFRRQIVWKPFVWEASPDAPADRRPLDCRFRQRDEGRPYPKSSCGACGRTILTGLGTECADIANGPKGGEGDQ